MTSRVKQNSNPPLRSPLNESLGSLEGYPTFSSHKLSADVISGPIPNTSRWSILLPPPRPVAVWPCTNKNYVVPYIIYILLLRYSVGFDGPFQYNFKHLPNLSKRFLRSFMSCTFLQSSGGCPPRQNAHLLSPPLLVNNALAVWGPFLRSFDPPRGAVKL